MKFLTLLLILIPATVFAQSDSLSLQCPLNDAVIKRQKGDYKYNTPDVLVLVVSQTDTIAKASIDGKISSVVRNNDGGYDIVMYHKKYYIWYTGVTKPMVAKGAVVKKGQAIGFIPVGKELEFLLYDDETPVDPAKHLLCGDRQ